MSRPTEDNKIARPDIDELERLANAATGKNWAWNDFRVPDLEATVGDPEVYEYRTEILEATHWGECGCRSACTLELNMASHDAEFIAGTGPDVIRALVAWIKHLEKGSDAPGA